ncbi:unnamed protein product [Penicillium camemberti]|uniref:Str. FM013 n=1 Tax=Penicillium camemberti (strain FM 013) TaxID=1429867 RepID=A0A0G4P4K0_PENC3|nr:unnamed protein product [Penicillium camemberti]
MRWYWTVGDEAPARPGKTAVSGAKSGPFRSHFHRSSYSSGT